MGIHTNSCLHVENLEGACLSSIFLYGFTMARGAPCVNCCSDTFMLHGSRL